MARTNKDCEQIRRYLCAHCRTGIVYKIPNRCPECDRWLNKPISKNKKKEK